MIVADTNLLVYFYVQGEYSDLADKAFRKDPSWISPLLWRSEFLNVLAACIKNRFVDFEAAIEIIGEAERLMAGHEYAISSLDILRLAANSKCSAYDCEFVALAMELKIPLLTMDQKILAEFPGTAIRLDEFVRQE